MASALARWFLPPPREFGIRTSLDAAATAARLAETMDRPSWWATTRDAGAVVGRVRRGRVEAWVAGGRNSWRPILEATIQGNPGGGSIVRGKVAAKAWVNVFSLLWLAGAVVLSGIIVLVAIVGAVRGESLMRGGDGHPIAPAAALLIAVGTFALFTGFGLALPAIARRMTAADPERLIEFVAVATGGTVERPEIAAMGR